MFHKVTQSDKSKGPSEITSFDCHRRSLRVLDGRMDIVKEEGAGEGAESQPIDGVE